MSEPELRRRAEDHPKENAVRVGLGVLFACAGIYLGVVELHVPMSACFVMCGTMMKIQIPKVLLR